MADVPQIFHEMKEVIEERERENEAGFDLWTWHPEHFWTKMFHGEYADEVQPPTEWNIRHATALISYLMGHDDEQIEQLLMLEQSPPQECYCGEIHAPLDDELHEDWRGSMREHAYEHMKKLKAIHEFPKAQNN